MIFKQRGPQMSQENNKVFLIFLKSPYPNVYYDRNVGTEVAVYVTDDVARSKMIYTL